MSYYLISWDIDNSVSVVKKNSKGIVTVDESQSRVSFKWPRKGVYDGKIVAMSDSKRDMDTKAIEMTKSAAKSGSEEQTATTSTASRKQETAKNRKKADDGTRDTVRRSHKSVKALQKKAELAASNAAAEEIFQKTDVQALQAEIEELKQQLIKAKDASHVISAEKNKYGEEKLFPSDSDEDVNSDEEVYISEYEKAAIRRREENRQLMKELQIYRTGIANGSLPESSGSDHVSTIKSNKRRQQESSNVNTGCTKKLKSNDDQESNATDKREKVPVQKVELVKNMGVMIKSTSLAAALRHAKRQPTRLLRYLMVELFTEDELRCSTVRGKKGSLPGLERDTMDAILCYTMAKGDEWGQPVTEESLIRQGNEKCYQYRRKK